ncbi:hypothetical protein TNCV_2516711 [Trichonephila clavipes]|nr:hypothetical protein TNCV_2516711 [Trichonephila clavipes]
MPNSCVMHRHTGPALGIMAWGGIGYHSHTPLVRIAASRSAALFRAANVGRHQCDRSAIFFLADHFDFILTIELNFDHSMTIESRTPSRPSTFTPTTLCLRRKTFTDDIQKFTLLVQGANSTLESLKRFGNYNGEDSFVTTIQNQPLEYTKLHNLAVSEFSSLPPCNSPGCPGHYTPPSSPPKIN